MGECIQNVIHVAKQDKENDTKRAARKIQKRREEYEYAQTTHRGTTDARDVAWQGRQGNRGVGCRGGGGGLVLSLGRMTL